MQAVSVDEALLEVGSHITEPEQCQEEALATKIRDEIRQATGCEASIGIGSNILLARYIFNTFLHMVGHSLSFCTRLSTKKAKPAGQYYCKTKQDIESLLASTSVIDLPGVKYFGRLL
jgi:DNA repair protein REV1